MKASNFDIDSLIPKLETVVDIESGEIYKFDYIQSYLSVNQAIMFLNVCKSNLKSTFS